MFIQQANNLFSSFGYFYTKESNLHVNSEADAKPLHHDHADALHSLSY